MLPQAAAPPPVDRRRPRPIAAETAQAIVERMHRRNGMQRLAPTRGGRPGSARPRLGVPKEVVPVFSFVVTSRWAPPTAKALNGAARRSSVYRIGGHFQSAPRPEANELPPASHVAAPGTHPEGSVRGPRTTPRLTQRGLLNRERESSGPISWGHEPNPGKSTLSRPGGRARAGRRPRRKSLYDNGI
jgi:hypothetical protein